MITAKETPTSGKNTKQDVLYKSVISLTRRTKSPIQGNEEKAERESRSKQERKFNLTAQSRERGRDRNGHKKGKIRVEKRLAKDWNILELFAEGLPMEYRVKRNA